MPRAPILTLVLCAACGGLFGSPDSGVDAGQRVGDFVLLEDGGLLYSPLDAGVGADGGSGGSGGSGTDGKIGSACQRDADCTELRDANCLKMVAGLGTIPPLNFPNGMCSRPCTADDAGCGAGSCVSDPATGTLFGQPVTRSAMFCGRSCMRDTECRQAEGYRCKIQILNFGYCAPP